MNTHFQARHLTRRFGDKLALDGIDLELQPDSVTGLIGRNGSGKTTLIRTIVGLLLPSAGDALTFGKPVADLGEAELGRIGAVFQENRLMGWMTVAGQLEFARAYHKHWDQAREATLLDVLELDPTDRVSSLSPGNAQKLALLLAVCPRPDLLLLDEPVSALDPIAREELLAFLLELVREDDTTILISSHVLVDIERVVDRIACLDRGRVVYHDDLDDLLEDYQEWLVTAPAGPLPECLTAGFREDWILERRGTGRQALLLVRPGANGNEAEARRAGFRERHGLHVEARPANLERIFPSLVGRRPGLRTPKQEVRP
ncbi:MAG: ABC transporter ATP-binding protein [Planctomycetota bacterium]|nr:ABC transporter ATP-binding protein [Planctomycetota bacterium]